MLWLVVRVLVVGGRALLLRLGVPGRG
jgi:hypothetical protein